MEEWLGLIGALSGTIIGGFVTYKVANQQHTFEKEKESERKYIEACEAIHEILSSVASQAAILNMGVIGEIGYSSPLKGDILKEKVQIDRLRMLVNFYMPELSEEVSSIRQHFQVVSGAVAEVLLQNEKNEEWKKSTVKSAMTASAQITNIANMAQEKLGQNVRKKLHKTQHVTLCFRFSAVLRRFVLPLISKLGLKMDRHHVK